MRVSLLEPDDPRWTDFLRTVRHDFYHLPGYAEVVARFDQGTACAILAEGADGAALVPLVRRTLPGDPGPFWDATSPYGYASPLVRPIPPSTDHLDGGQAGAVARWLRDRGCVSLFLRSHPLIPGMLCPQGAVTVQHGNTVVCRLAGGDADQWSKTRSSHRYEIRRAEREGFEVSIERHPVDLSSFQELYRETMRRLNAKDEYLFDSEYFNGLRDALADSLVLVCVRMGAEIAAAGLFVVSGEIVQYHLSGSDERYRSFAPTKLLIHAARSWATREGCQLFHLGGGRGGSEDRLANFKLGFSPERAPFFTTRIVVNPDVYSMMDASGSRGDLGCQELTAFFPGYRDPSGD